MQIPPGGTTPATNIYLPMPSGQAVVTGTAPLSASSHAVYGTQQVPVVQVNQPQPATYQPTVHSMEFVAQCNVTFLCGSQTASGAGPVMQQATQVTGYIRSLDAIPHSAVTFFQTQQQQLQQLSLQRNYGSGVRGNTGTWVYIPPGNQHHLESRVHSKFNVSISEFTSSRKSWMKL